MVFAIMLFVCYLTLLFVATARGGTRTFKFAEPLKLTMGKNGTLCTYFKQFDLSSSTKLTVCDYIGKRRIDIRHFTNDRPSIRGIHLTLAEWETFLALFAEIQTAVNKTL